MDGGSTIVFIQDQESKKLETVAPVCICILASWALDFFFSRFVYLPPGTEKYFLFQMGLQDERNWPIVWSRST
jgi:hypothetical protein